MLELATSPTSVTLTVVGDLDLAEREQFPLVISQVDRLSRQLLVLDLCRATFLDSCGAAFLTCLADLTVRAGGRTAVRGATAQALFVLEVCGGLDPFRIDSEHACPRTEAVDAWSLAGQRQRV